MTPIPLEMDLVIKFTFLCILWLIEISVILGGLYCIALGLVIGYYNLKKLAKSEMVEDFK